MQDQLKKNMNYQNAVKKVRMNGSKKSGVVNILVTMEN